MNKYTIYCTKEQTEMAYKLGAPIYEYFEEGTHYPQLEKPTAEQMCGWLREKGLCVEVFKNGELALGLSAVINTEEDGGIDASIEPSDDYTTILLSAIDAALDFLEKERII